MTTQLDSLDTRFLPYNKGVENPPVSGDKGYRSEYLWNDILTPDSLLDIIENFVVEVEEKEYFYNPKKKGIDSETKKVLIFPRFHQLEVIRNLRNSIKTEGIGATTSFNIQQGQVNHTLSVGCLTPYLFVSKHL